MVINKGLEGIEFAETSLSAINGEQGLLSFCGYMVTDLGENASYEEVSYLLWNKRLPTAVELDQHSRWLTENRPLPKPVWGIMHVLPDQAEPMEALRTVTSTLSMFDRSEDYLSNGHLALCQAVSLTAKLPTIVTSFDRLRHSLPPIEPKQTLGHAANFLYMLTGREPDPLDAKALETYLTMLADHGMNPSTFSARVTTSTLGDIYSAIVAALGTLKGPLHGGATEASMQQLEDIGTAANVAAWLEERMRHGRRIMGFGHRVYKIEDPRATVLRRLSSEVCERNGDGHWYEIAARLEERVLAEPYFQKRSLFTNVDFYTAPLLSALGIPKDLSTSVFAVARISGWTAHVLEQRENNRLIRPRARYCGPGMRSWSRLADR
jgi:citrate synthase